MQFEEQFPKGNSRTNIVRGERGVVVSTALKKVFQWYTHKTSGFKRQVSKCLVSKRPVSKRKVY